MTDIPITLTPEQRIEARSGIVSLTPEQIASANAKRVIARREYSISCVCGECAKCRNRERSRAKRAAEII